MSIILLEQEKIRSRLKDSIGYTGLSMRKISLEAGLSDSMVNKFVSTKSSLSVDGLSSILSTLDSYGINQDWVLTGRGAMVKGKVVINDKGVPFVKNVIAWAGRGGELGNEYIAGYIDLPEYKRCDVAITVEGASMEPVLKGGDIILVSLMPSLSDVSWGKIHLVVTNESCFVKYIMPGNCADCLRMLSANPMFQEQVVKHQDVLNIYQVKGKITEI